MKLKLPPALTLAFFMGFMYLLSIYLPVGYFDFFGRFVLIKVLLVSAALIIIIAMFQFMRARTTIDPINPAKAEKLVTWGIYNYTRNPMYLAMLILLLAWGLWLGNAFNTILAAGFVAFMNRYQIGREETALQARFGKPYEQYCLKVRRWF